MLIDVLERLSNDTGLHIVQQRDALVKLANQSAREIYHQLECSRIYLEVSCVVAPNNIVALPSQVGELRGARQHVADTLVPVEPMVSRYVTATQGYKWKNWRDLGESPVMRLPVSIDVLTLSAVTLENAVVKINGKTSVAASEEESITLDSSPKDTTKLWDPSVSAITSSSTRNYDITIKDADANIVAVLYNNEKRTRYRMIDVSELLWGIDSSAGETIIDILYKKPLVFLSKDTDSFPAGDMYDEAWHARAMSLHYAPMQGRQQDANKYNMASLVLLRNIKDGTEYGEVKKFTFGRNKFMDHTNYLERTGYFDSDAPVTNGY